MKLELRDFGWSPELGEVLNSTTERLLRAAGVSEGMAVLDISCGSADVAKLAADFVGPNGRVVSVAPRGGTLDHARACALAGGYHNIDFRCGDSDAYPPASFDAVVCRHVVIAHRDPAAFMRSAARLVRRGGVLALHEMDMSRGIHASPPLPQLRLVNQIIHDALERAGVLSDAGGRLVDLLDEADLQHPQLFSETMVGSGEDHAVPSSVAAVMRSLLPHVTATERALVGIDKLEQGLRRSALILRSQVEFFPQVCCWLRL